MSNSFETCPTHFSRGEKNFVAGALPPCATPSYGPVSVFGSHLKTVFRYPYPVENVLSCWISKWQTGYWSSLAHVVSRQPSMTSGTTSDVLRSDVVETVWKTLRASTCNQQSG